MRRWEEQNLFFGGAQAVLDYVIPYVNERHAFGEPISHRQAVAFNVADIAIELEAMRLLTLRAAARADAGKDFARDVALARVLCGAKGRQIGSDGIQLLGGHGFVKEHPVERWYRDLRAVVRRVHLARAARRASKLRRSATAFAAFAVAPIPQPMRTAFSIR